MGPYGSIWAMGPYGPMGPGPWAMGPGLHILCAKAWAGNPPTLRVKDGCVQLILQLGLPEGMLADAFQYSLTHDKVG